MLRSSYKKGLVLSLPLFLINSTWTRCYGPVAIKRGQRMGHIVYIQSPCLRKGMVTDTQASIRVGSVLDGWDGSQLSYSRYFGLLVFRVSRSFSVGSLCLNWRERSSCLWATLCQVEAMIYFFLHTQPTDCVTFHGQRCNLVHGFQALSLEVPFVSGLFAAKSPEKHGLPHGERELERQCVSSGLLLVS